MNDKLKYGIISAILLVIVTYFIASFGRHFNWEVTFIKESDEPFGCLLFDELMESSLKGGYEVQKQIPEGMDPKREAILYVKESVDFDVQEGYRASKIVDFAREGGVAIVATRNIQLQMIRDSYKVEEDSNYITDSDYIPINEYIQECRVRPKPPITVTTTSDNKTHRVADFMAVGHFLSKFYDPKRYKVLLSLDTKVSAWSQDKQEFVPVKQTEALAFARNYKSGGKVIFVSVPLFFTNYGVMDDSNRAVLEYLLAPVQDRHLVRVLGINERTSSPDKKDSEFSALLSRPPLRCAFYLALATLILFCLFSMRRKMRPIPLPVETKNTTLEFAKFLGTYSFVHQQPGHLLLAKYNDFLRSLNHQYGIKADTMKNQELCDFIVHKTGADPEKVIQLIRTANSITNGNSITKADMITFLDLINHLIQNS